MLGYSVTVNSLESSVTASNRKFACMDEEVVYRCIVTAAEGSSQNFSTVWTWGTTRVNTFMSFQRIGRAGSCAHHDQESTLHTTLVSTTNNTCVSLLIVVPSLAQNISSYLEESNGMQVVCGARVQVQSSNQDQECGNQTKIHYLSGKYNIIILTIYCHHP